MLTEQGKVYSFGYNAYGQLGDGTSTSYKPYIVPVDTSGVLKGKNITMISSGVYAAIVQDANGALYLWGTMWAPCTKIACTSVPVSVSTSFLSAGETITSISHGYSNVLILTNLGNIYGAGDKTYSMLDSTTSGTVTTFMLVNKFSAILGVGETIVEVSAGINVGMVRTNLKRALVWGSNTNGACK